MTYSPEFSVCQGQLGEVGDYLERKASSLQSLEDCVETLETNGDPVELARGECGW